MRTVGIVGKRSGPNIPGRRTIRARQGGHANVSLTAGAFPVVEMTLAKVQQAFAGHPEYKVRLGIGDRPVQ